VSDVLREIREVDEGIHFQVEIALLRTLQVVGLDAM
jgi:hypothetical protein